MGSCSEAELCPMEAMWQYLRLRGSVAKQLFCHLGRAPLTKHQFWAVISKVFGQLGLEGFQFGIHSFWIDAKSTAAAIGYLSSGFSGLGAGSQQPLLYLACSVFK